MVAFLDVAARVVRRMIPGIMPPTGQNAEPERQAFLVDAGTLAAEEAPDGPRMTVSPGRPRA